MSQHTIAGKQVVSCTDNERALQAVAGSFDGIIDTVSAKHDISQLLPLLKVKRLLISYLPQAFPKPMPLLVEPYKTRACYHCPSLPSGRTLSHAIGAQTNGRLILLGVPPDPHSFSAGALLFKRSASAQRLPTLPTAVRASACLFFEGNVTYCDGIWGKIRMKDGGRAG